MTHDQLPVELLQLIAEVCPRPTHKTLLFVSKTFHDLALPLLFSNVTLTFGILRPLRRRGNNDDSWTEEETAQLNKHNNRSFAVLQRLEQDPSLANAVRVLSTHWYESPFGQSDALALEALARVLNMLSNLVSFEWRGDGQIISQHAATALRRCESLRSLLIPPAQFLWPELLDLRNLTRITLMFSLKQWFSTISSVPAAHKERYESALRFVDANAACLEDITLSYWMSPSVPLPRLKRATFLRSTAGPVGLAVLIQHSPLLVSLTLTTYAPDVESILSAFTSFPEAFPHLTAFKFLIGSVRDYDVTPIVTFLQNKQRLCRLHLGFSSTERALSEPIARLLPKLPNLENLGLGWGGMQFTTAQEHTLMECLPHNLRVLLLNVDEDAATFEAFLRVIRQRPTLRAFWIHSHYNLDFNLENALADKESSVELVSMGKGDKLLYRCRPTNSTHSLCSPNIDPSLTLADHDLDGWQWLAEHGSDLGSTTLTISSPCCAPNVTDRTFPLLKCVDLRPLEGSSYVLDHRAFGLQ